MDLGKHWKTIVDTLQDGLIIVDPRGNIAAVNPAAEKLTGYSAGELIGKSCRVLGCTGCKIKGKGIGKNWCSLFERGEVKAKQCMITGKNRINIHIVKNASILKDENGNTIGAVETLKDMSEVIRQQQEIAELKKSCRLDEGFHGIIGESPPIQRLFELIDSVSRTDAPVLILGQSGTGKELVARAIHDSSPRKEGPFIKVNCAALNENLLESELFGHVKGAYTGASQARMGRFEAAHGGTILLDEIGDIPPSTQIKLLRVLEEREIERVGDHRPVPIDVRIISATNRDIETLVEQNLFRDDLFFRINVFPIYCPPLSERKDDIPLIIQNFINHYTTKVGKSILGLTSCAMENLLAYHWPGNVRELRNAIEYAFVLCADEWIDTPHLPPKIIRADRTPSPPPPSNTDLLPYRKEREDLINVLKKAKGNQSEAARQMNISRITVWKRIKKFGIDIDADVKGKL